jgi:hypothetical protein
MQLQNAAAAEVAALRMEKWCTFAEVTSKVHNNQSESTLSTQL